MLVDGVCVYVHMNACALRIAGLGAGREKSWSRESVHLLNAFSEFSIRGSHAC